MSVYHTSAFHNGCGRALPESVVQTQGTVSQVLDCLGLEPRHASLLTVDDFETNLHAVPLHCTTHKGMARTARYYRHRYTTFVGFQPTGWTHSASARYCTCFLCLLF